ncbi:hypothetical protein KCP70_04330 [Salmonella enterica subsp. enterica]|nr:hypothetical protein KCP70_04330 [Salmonella enterica subsp. enterica]
MCRFVARPLLVGSKTTNRPAVAPMQSGCKPISGRQWRRSAPRNFEGVHSRPFARKCP